MFILPAILSGLMLLLSITPNAKDPPVNGGPGGRSPGGSRITKIADRDGVPKKRREGGGTRLTNPNLDREVSDRQVII